MSDRYAVFGHPVGHSRSPAIHTVFATQTHQAMRYDAIEAPKDDFASAWRTFVESGGRGGNVTVPFKQDAYALTQVLTPRATLAGAVNTLWQGSDGRLHGDNTDGIGLVRDLAYHGVELAGSRVLLLGAGGASRGAMGPLREAGVSELIVANRTPARAELLAALYVGPDDLPGDVDGQNKIDGKGSIERHGRIVGCGFGAVEGAFDLVINATSASLAGDLPPLADEIFADDGVAYDMMYAAEPTVFLGWSRDRGARTLDGLGMLIEQAAESFWIWRQVRPDTAVLRERLRRAL